MNGRFTTTEQLMDFLKTQIIQYSNGEEISNDNYKRSSSTPTEIDLSRFKEEAEKNNWLWNVSADQPITSHRKVIGRFLIFGKKFVRKFLRWYVSNTFKTQSEFNASVTRSLNELMNVLIVTKTKIEEVTSTQTNILNRIDLVEGEILRQRTLLTNTEIYDFENDVNDQLKKDRETLSFIKQEINNLHEEFNSFTVSNSNQLNKDNEILSKIQQEINNLYEEFNFLTVSNNEHKNTVNELIFPKLDELNGRMLYNEQQFRADINFLNYRIRKLKNQKGSSIAGSHKLPEANEGETYEVNNVSSFDYLLFENRYRGSMEDIRNRQLKYIPYFKNKENVIDIGCGRGEFLELLLNHNIKAQGIDLTDEMVEYCQDIGLPVIKKDAITYLEQQDDNSIGGIFLGQVIEHIPFDDIIKLVEIAHRKLAANGYLIMETPNPQTLAIFTRSFYMDPTHVNPVHPLTIQFLTESVGFRETAILYSGRVDKENALPHIQVSNDSISNVDELNRSIDRLNDLLYGDQDYAIIARK